MKEVTVKEALALGLQAYRPPTKTQRARSEADFETGKTLIRYNGNLELEHGLYVPVDLSDIDPDNVPTDIVFLVPTTLDADLDHFVPMTLEYSPTEYNYIDDLVTYLLPQSAIDEAHQILHDAFKKAYLESEIQVYQLLDYQLINRRL